MRMFPPKHIIPAPINNPRDHLIKEVNNVSLTTNMTVKITTQEAISMARGHRTGRRELGIWHIGMRLTVGLHLNVGGGWRGRPSSARGPPGAYPPRPPFMYVDRDGYDVQPLQQRAFYDGGDRSGYVRPPLGYNNTDPLGMPAPPSQGVGPDMRGPYPMAAPPHVEAPGSEPLVGGPVGMPSRHHIPSNESLNPDNSTTREYSLAEDSVHTSQTQINISSGRKQRRAAQHVYEADEADRKARGLKPHVIACDSMGMPDESGRPGTRFVEILRTFCGNYLNVSIVKVRLQNPDDYATLREEVEREFEWVGHDISDTGFKKAVSKCMKAERSRLHKLYLSNPGRACPPREEPTVWESLKTYWKSADFGKVSKVSSYCSKLWTLPSMHTIFSADFAHRIGHHVMLGFDIAQFTRGSWVNPGYGGCKGLRQNPLAPRPIWNGWHNIMAGIALLIRCR